MNTPTFAAPKPDVVELVDTSDLGSDAARCGGSSPSIRTDKVDKLKSWYVLNTINC